MSEGAAGQGPVVVAYDGSDQAKAAIGTAGGLLGPGRRAIVLTIWERLESIPFWGAPMTVIPQEAFDRVISHAKEVADEGAALAAEAGFEAEARTVDGSPVWWAISEFADENDAELIVMGSHGRSGISYAVMGSVATAVCQHASCPVMIGRRPNEG